MTKKLLMLFGLLLTAVLTLDAAEVELKFDFFDKENPFVVRVNFPFVATLDRLSYDVRVGLSAKEELDTRVVIIDIDERSLKVEGQWPWARARFADLVNSLYDNYQIDTVGFDIIFPEPEDSYTDTRVNSLVNSYPNSDALLEELRGTSGDIVFANSFTDRSVVLGAAFQTIQPGEDVTESSGVLPVPAFINSELDYQRIYEETSAPLTHRYSSNIAVLADKATATGFFSISPLVGDPDGIIRRVELLTRYEGKLYVSMALQLVQTFFFDEIQPVVIDNPADNYEGLEAIRMIHEDIPVDAQAAVYVPYAVRNKAYQYVPATDILSGAFKGDITGAIAIVGTSASGLVDLRNTPVGAALPGVEVHANVVSAILDNNFRTKPSYVTAADLLLLVLAGLLLSLTLPFLPALWSTILFSSVMVTAMWSNWYFWDQKSVILSIAPTLLLCSALYLINTIAGFFSESQARRTTQKMFGLYVPPEVVSEMSETADIFSLKSQKRELTVFFCDIRNFTTISESMEPEQLSEWLNDFLTPMTQIIHKHGGAIDKYMGDAIMAFWGAPLEDPDHAANGIRAAVEMIDYLDTLNEESRAKGWPEINIGCGLNTGMMSVGNMGSEFRMAYTVLGDAVNLGARLESMTKEYKVSIIVSEFTVDAAPDFKYDYLDNVKVKGKNTAVKIYSPDRELQRQDHMEHNVVSVKRSAEED